MKMLQEIFYRIFNENAYMNVSKYFLGFFVFCSRIFCENSPLIGLKSFPGFPLNIPARFFEKINTF